MVEAQPRIGQVRFAAAVAGLCGFAAALAAAQGAQARINLGVLGQPVAQPEAGDEGVGVVEPLAYGGRQQDEGGGTGLDFDRFACGHPLAL